MDPKEVKSLTRAEKLQLLELVEEQERRDRERRVSYKPNSGQAVVHKSPARERFVFSGNGSGKTCLAVQEALWWAQGYNPVTQQYTPVPARVVVLLDSPDKVGDVWIPEIARWINIDPERLEKRGRPYVNRITFQNNSEIKFMFHEQLPLAFESLEIDYLICDEPPPHAVYKALLRGARRKGSKPRFLIIGTPITAAWMRTEIYEPWSRGELPDCDCIRFGTVVNEANLADDYIKNFSRSLTEKERQIRIEGQFYDLDGLALAGTFKRNIHVIPPFDWSKENPVIVAIDPHPSKAHFAVLLGTDRDNQHYVLRTLKAKQIARDFAKTLKSWMEGYRVVDIVADSLGSSEGTGNDGFLSFIQVLRDEGVKVRATTWQEKSEEDFIQRICEVLYVPEEPNLYGQRIPKLRIIDGNNGLISDIENVQWVKHRDIDEYKPKLDLQHKDFLSCLKYALAANPNFSKSRGVQYSRTRPVTAYGQRANSPAYYRRKLID